MPKTRAKKEQEIQEVKENLKKSKAVVFASYENVSVKNMEKLRRELRANAAELKGVKKTLLNRAFAESGVEALNLPSSGNVALVYSYEDETVAAKMLYNFSREHEGMKLAGGMLENKILDGEHVIALAKLPGKQEMRSILVGTLAAPISGFARVLSGTVRGLLTALSGIRDAKQP